LSRFEVSAQELFEIEQAASSEAERHWSLEDYKLELASPLSNLFWMPEIEAFVLYRQVEQEIEIMNLAVRCKGEGRGRQLLEVFLSQLDSESVVWLEVKDTNARAVALYKSLGFKLVSQRHNYYRDAASALVMRLNL
jgi:[ribosomal protein S18]-alanine N-acetyltransferase